jgi:predicted nucleotidyltransferase
MSWYKGCMPTVASIKDNINTIASEMKKVCGVKDVLVWGSYAENINNPNFVLKDVDIIATTNFDSGDLLAIDNSKYSAIKIAYKELEDLGFSPQAVSFTKKFLSYANCNIDHWAVSKDKVLLHWGAIPDSIEDWSILNTEAEEYALKQTNASRHILNRFSSSVKKEWRKSYDEYISKYVNDKAAGWYPSEHNLEVLEKAIQI